MGHFAFYVLSSSICQLFEWRRLSLKGLIAEDNSPLALKDLALKVKPNILMLIHMLPFYVTQTYTDTGNGSSTYELIVKRSG